MNSSIATTIMLILAVQVASVVFCREPRLITWDRISPRCLRGVATSVRLPEPLGAHHMHHWRHGHGAWRRPGPHPPSPCGSGDRSTLRIICLYEQGGSRRSDWSLPEVGGLDECS